MLLDVFTMSLPRLHMCETFLDSNNLVSNFGTIVNTRCCAWILVTVCNQRWCWLPTLYKSQFSFAYANPNFSHRWNIIFTPKIHWDFLP